jgi:imidazolonepropionase-like amidohydrolase
MCNSTTATEMANIQQRASAPTKFALKNVRVFDGSKIGDPSTVIIDGAIIGSDATNAVEIDGEGGVLLPGLIDAHIHVHDLDDLKALSKFGITTGLGMGEGTLEVFSTLRDAAGAADVRSPGMPATVAGSRHSKIKGFDPKNLVKDPSDATRFVHLRVSEGADYIKVIADNPGPDQPTLNALVTAAHNASKLCIAHASSFEAISMSQEAGVDIITHTPLDKKLDTALTYAIKKKNIISCPTLVKMQAHGNQHPSPTNDYGHARSSLTDLHAAGVTILAGSDANKRANNAKVAYGDSLHTELELLVEAGLSTVEVLQAATVLPARIFGLSDRGKIAPGKRADLLLISEDPLKEIKATRSVKRVWCAGIEVEV